MNDFTSDSSVFKKKPPQTISYLYFPAIHRSNPDLVKISFMYFESTGCQTFRSTGTSNHSGGALAAPTFITYYSAKRATAFT
jgi:hypothetical protein